MPDLPLTPEQEAQAQALYGRLKDCFDAEAMRLARLMASKDDAHLLGDTEFQVRDRVHGLGARVLQLALDERKKGLPRLQRQLPALQGSGAVRRLARANGPDANRRP